MRYTLAMYFQEAEVSPFPRYFHDIEICNPIFKTPMKPRWHQVTALAQFFKGSRFGLYDEQGTGKTLVAAAIAAWQGAVGNGCVCIMPPVLLPQFKQAIYGLFPGIEEKLKVEIYRGTQTQRNEMLVAWENNNPNIVLMSYEIFLKEGFVAFKDYEALIMDECSILGNEDNKSYLAVTSFMGKVGDKYGLAMNGTPASSDLTALYGYIKFTSPEIYRSKLQFDTKHVIWKNLPVRYSDKSGGTKIREVRTIDSYQEEDFLFQSLYKRARRVLKSEIMQLPSRNIIPFSFELSDAHYEKYREFVTSKLLIFDDNSILDGTTSSGFRVNAMQSVIHADMLQIKERSAIYDALDVIIEGLDLTTTKIFVVAHHRKTVELTAFLYAKYNPAIIYGGTPDKEKEKRKFLEDDSCRMLVANYKSGGVGLDGLQNVCHTGVAVEPMTAPGIFDQTVDRLHRSGQNEKVNFYVLMPKGTAYVKAVHCMVKRKNINDGVVSRRQLEQELLGEFEMEDAVELIRV